MKVIKLGCKTAGFQFGDTAEVGTGKGKIDAEIAQDLIDGGLATEVKEKVASSGGSDKAITALEGQVETLTEDKAALEGQVETLTEDKAALEGQVETLTGFVDAAIDLAKGTVPNGYVKA